MNRPLSPPQSGELKTQGSPWKTFLNAVKLLSIRPPILSLVDLDALSVTGGSIFKNTLQPDEPNKILLGF